jgi:uridine kinase
MKTLVIGIAGGSGSGKSTFCNILKKQLTDKKVFVINMDNYFKNPIPKMTSPITQRMDEDWNNPHSIDYEKPLEILRTLKSDGSYDIIIIEGILLFCYDEIRELLDLKIFIELDSDERMFRRIKRNTGNFTNRDGYKGIDYQSSYYLHFAKYQEQKFSLPSKVHADVILNGNKLDGVALDIVFAWVQFNNKNK